MASQIQPKGTLNCSVQGALENVKKNWQIHPCQKLKIQGEIQEGTRQNLRRKIYFVRVNIEEEILELSPPRNLRKKTVADEVPALHTIWCLSRSLSIAAGGSRADQELITIKTIFVPFLSPISEI